MVGAQSSEPRIRKLHGWGADRIRTALRSDDGATGDAPVNAPARPVTFREGSCSGT